jgi:hypothetical protein
LRRQIVVAIEVPSGRFRAETVRDAGAFRAETLDLYRLFPTETLSHILYLSRPISDRNGIAVDARLSGFETRERAGRIESASE